MAKYLYTTRALFHSSKTTMLWKEITFALYKNILHTSNMKYWLVPNLTKTNDFVKDGVTLDGKRTPSLSLPSLISSTSVRWSFFANIVYTRMPYLSKTTAHYEETCLKCFILLKGLTICILMKHIVITQSNLPICVSKGDQNYTQETKE